MIAYLHYNDQLSTFISEGNLSRFLHQHLGVYGDDVVHIQRAIDYVPTHGGHITLQYKEEQLIGAVVINATGMSGYIPEHILVYIALDPSVRGQGLGKELLLEAISQVGGDIALHVEPNNPATHLYRSVGFTNPYLEMRLKRG